MTDSMTFTRTVKIGNETREVQFRKVSEDHYLATAADTKGIFVKGPGGKHWTRPLIWHCEKDCLLRNEVILNRNGYRLIGFAKGDDSNASNHNSAYA